MKLRTVIPFLALLAVLAGCSKELRPAKRVFNATVEAFEPIDGSTKTALSDDGASGFCISWSDGDRIRINDFCYTAENSSGGTASFVSEALDAPSPTFKACYPYEITGWSGGKMSVNLPSVQQEPASGVVSGFPMYAESSSGSLSFKNLCGLLKLNLKSANDPFKVTSIKLESDNLSLSGECEIQQDGSSDAWKAVPAGSPLNPAGVTYTCNRTVSTSGEDFYIYLPQCDYEGFDITVNTDCGSFHRAAKTGVDVRIYRSRVTGISLSLDPKYNNHDYVNLGLTSGLKWATMNVGATSVSGIGTNSTWADASASSWGGRWRVPTKDDFVELATGTFWRWTSSYMSSGVAGFIVFKTKADSDKGRIGSPASGVTYSEESDTHIFLPATSGDHKQGNYWSATASDATSAYDLHFVSSSSREYQVLDKTATLFVRPVCP